MIWIMLKSMILEEIRELDKLYIEKSGIIKNSEEGRVFNQSKLIKGLSDNNRFRLV